LNERDVTYSRYRPELAVLGAVDGRPGSGRPQDNDDALSRRDMGLEFLDVTSQASVTLVGSRTIDGGRRQEDVYRITNTSSTIIDTHLLIVARGLPDQIVMENASGMTTAGDPYRREFLRDGALLPGQSIVERLVFRRPSHAPAVGYTLVLLSGQGNP